MCIILWGYRQHSALMMTCLHTERSKTELSRGPAICSLMKVRSSGSLNPWCFMTSSRPLTFTRWSNIWTEAISCCRENQQKTSINLHLSVRITGRAERINVATFCHQCWMLHPPHMKTLLTSLSNQVKGYEIRFVPNIRKLIKTLWNWRHRIQFCLRIIFFPVSKKLV